MFTQRYLSLLPFECRPRAYSHGVLPSPLLGGRVVLGSVSLEDLSNLRHERIIRVGVRQQGADGEENLGDSEGWRPLLLENIKADGAVRVDVRVVDSRGEVDLRRLEGVIRREMDVQEEDTTSVGRVIGAHDGCLPVVWILLVDWPGGAVGWWVLAEVDQFFLNSFDC